MHKKEEAYEEAFIFKNENIAFILRNAGPNSWLFRMSKEKNAVCISWLMSGQFASLRLQFQSEEEAWYNALTLETYPPLEAEDPLLQTYSPQKANLIAIATRYETFSLATMLKPMPNQAANAFGENSKSQKAGKGIAWLAEAKTIKSSFIFKQEKDRDIVAALKIRPYSWALRESSSQNSITPLKLFPLGWVLASRFTLTNRGWVEELQTGDQQVHLPILKTDPLLNHYLSFEFADLMAILIRKKNCQISSMYLPKQEESSMRFNHYRPRRDDLVINNVGSDIPCPIEEIQKLKSFIKSLPEYDSPRAPSTSQIYMTERKGAVSSLRNLRQKAYREGASFETLLTWWVLANNLASGLICPKSHRLMLGEKDYPLIVAEKGYRAHAYSCVFTAEGKLNLEWAFLKETPYGLEGYASLSQDCVKFFESYVRKTCLVVDEMNDLETKYINENLLSSSSSSSSTAVSTQSIFRLSDTEANRRKDDAYDYSISAPK